jgi:hypothetical protein
VYFDGGNADGDVDASPLSWQIEILGEHCDNSPWCVNIPLEDIDGVATPIITDGAPYYPRFAAPPVLPTATDTLIRDTKWSTQIYTGQVRVSLRHDLGIVRKRTDKHLSQPTVSVAKKTRSKDKKHRRDDHDEKPNIRRSFWVKPICDELT